MHPTETTTDRVHSDSAKSYLDALPNLQESRALIPNTEDPRFKLFPRCSSTPPPFLPLDLSLAPGRRRLASVPKPALRERTPCLRRLLRGFLLACARFLAANVSSGGGHSCAVSVCLQTDGSSMDSDNIGLSDLD